MVTLFFVCISVHQNVMDEILAINTRLRGSFDTKRNVKREVVEDNIIRANNGKSASFFIVHTVGNPV